MAALRPLSEYAKAFCSHVHIGREGLTIGRQLSGPHTLLLPKSWLQVRLLTFVAPSFHFDDGCILGSTEHVSVLFSYSSTEDSVCVSSVRQPDAQEEEVIGASESPKVVTLPSQPTTSRESPPDGNAEMEAEAEIDTRDRREDNID